MEYQTPQFFRLMQYAAAAERDVVELVSGGPDWNAPSAIGEGLHEFADLDGNDYQYPPSAGLTELREEIAARRGVAIENVVVTNGAGEANSLALAAALDRDAGREVLLTDPVYPYYPGKTQLFGGVPRYVPVDADGSLDPAAVRERASDEMAAIVVNTPNNPTGAVYGEETMAELVDIAAAHDAILVSDEVYDHFDYTGEFASALAVDSPHRIVTNAFSKSMAITGFRVGYGVFPNELVDGVRSRHMLVNVAGSRPAQYAVLRALRGTGPEYYERNRERLVRRIDGFTDALDDAGAEYTAPDGGFYVMARFPEFPGTMANAERLVDEAGVAAMPGETFGEARADWFRFALVSPEIETAGRRLADFFG
ncbi:pyridoxal phosphate-dependent aminotransferase [Halococcus thailandensis]|uniref:Aspartate transaminase n=1 Tax=Halococcus thailandensis JCM 13552 TaxID=1227457 RepID=M0N1U8_9EURY|nr:pyridoxal phosphate-dependent aminotransferase [Halococcus thailandensis]EMA51488.1 aspartate transaminase [Halococcus thailandensis JCM 13552]